MNDRTWEDIGNEIRDDYLRPDGPESVQFREVQWNVWLAEVERMAAEKAFNYAVGIVGLDPDYVNHFCDSNPYRRKEA